jgi:hypothetical protein
MKFVIHPFIRKPHTLWFQAVRSTDKWFEEQGGLIELKVSDFKREVRLGWIKKITEEEELFLELI